MVPISISIPGLFLSALDSDIHLSSACLYLNVLRHLRRHMS